MILIPLNGLDTTCSEGWHCHEDQICDNMNCVPCEEGLEPDEYHLNCIPTCAVGEDCPEDQVCDKSNCVSCEEGHEPDESQLNCISSMYYHFLSTTIRDNSNAFKWCRYNMCSRQRLP